MNEIAELARQINREKIERARAMSISEKFLAGAELFEEACEVSRSGIRNRHPEWNEEQVEAELVRRLEIGRRIEAATSR
jgi:hypothetical protein